MLKLVQKMLKIGQYYLTMPGNGFNFKKLK